jgi:hypothetical protein
MGGDYLFAVLAVGIVIMYFYNKVKNKRNRRK